MITGAAQGLGKAIAETLACAGAQVVVGDVKDDLVRNTVQEIANGSFKADGIRLDVADDAAATAALAMVLEKFGRLDILVNNAGIDFTKPLEELTVEEWDKVVRVNLRGPAMLCKKVFPLMRRQGGGQIVNITSTAAKRAWPNASAYHASKWGLLGFSHALHTEGRPFNIKVTAVVAGGMRTPFILERFPEAEANLQDPRNVAETVRFVLTLPAESVIPEVMVIPMRETSWP